MCGLISPGEQQMAGGGRGVGALRVSRRARRNANLGERIESAFFIISRRIAWKHAEAARADPHWA